MAALVFGSLRFEPVSWLAFLAVIVVHQLGHAFFVRAMGHRLSGIDLTGYGGQCRFGGRADLLDHAIIAWGGVLAQLALLFGTLLVMMAFGSPSTPGGKLVEHAFVEVNLWIVGINLLPFPPLDGARAWRLFPELRARGWSFLRLLIHPLWLWADRRRRARMEGTGPAHEPSASGAQPLPRPLPRRTSSPVPAVPDTDVDRGGDDDIDEKPSAQAQRELAALLERIGDEAGRAKKRR